LSPWESLLRLCLDYVGDITVSSSNNQASLASNLLEPIFSNLIVNKCKVPFFSVKLIICYWFVIMDIFFINRNVRNNYKELYLFFVTVNSAVGPYRAAIVCPLQWPVLKHFSFKYRKLRNIYTLYYFFLVDEKSAVGPYWELLGCPWRGRCTHRTVYSGRSRWLGVSEYNDGRDKCTLSVQNQSIVLISKKRICCGTLLFVRCVVVFVVNNCRTYLFLLEYLYLVLMCVLILFKLHWYRYPTISDFYSLAVDVNNCCTYLFLRDYIYLLLMWVLILFKWHCYWYSSNSELLLIFWLMNWYVTKIFCFRYFFFGYTPIIFFCIYGKFMWSKKKKSEGANKISGSTESFSMLFKNISWMLNGWSHESADCTLVLCLVDAHPVDVWELLMIIINKCFRICNPSLVRCCECITVPLPSGGHHWVWFGDLSGITYVPLIFNGR